MEGVSSRDAVRRAAVEARDSRIINMSELARRVGWTQPMMIKFCEEGQGEESKVKLLEAELRKLGLFGDRNAAMASELEALAQFLRLMDVSSEEKVAKFREFVRYYAERLDILCTADKESE